MRHLAPMGLFSVLVPAVLALPVTTAPGGPTPRPVPAAVQSLAVAGVDAAALAADAGASPGRGRPFLLTARTPTRPFTTLGVTWAQDSGSGAVVVSARTRGDKGWSPWSPLEVAADEGPDDISPEALAAGVRAGTAPSWVGEADGVQVRVDVPAGRAPSAVRIELVDPGESAADATLGQVSAPLSTAVAATGRPAVISRAQWGADESLRKGEPSYASNVKVAYVHHTASTNDYTADEAAQQVRGFYAYHTQSLGWNDIGYNFLVDKFGRIYEGRYGGLERAVIGAHAGGFNTGTTGVSMIGTYTSVAPSTATLAAVRDLLAWKLSLHGADPLGKQVLTSGGGSSSKYEQGTEVTVDVILGHRDTNKTACPGDMGYSKLPALRRSVADQIAASPSSTSQSTPAIDAKHAELGGSSGFLGAPTAPEATASGGRYRSYEGGTIYWSEASGAFEVHGGILDRWGTLGRQSGALGFPVTDESVTRDRAGRYNHFQGGSIYWSPTTGAQSVQGSIRTVWSQLGWETGPLGYPLTNESVTRDRAGRYNHFQGGSIYWSPTTGAQSVQGSIRTVWSQLGWETGPLGYPLTPERVAPDGRGRYNHFQSGSVYWSPTTGAHEVRGSIRERWSEMGWELGWLGYPTSNEYDVPGGRRSDFQQGSIVWTAATGSTTVL